MENLILSKYPTVENWASTFFCNPEYYVEAESVDDLKQILNYARENKRQVKVIGNRHSPSDIEMTPEIMVDILRMNKVLKIDKELWQVTVEAGILITELNAVLRTNNLALSVLPSLSDFTVGGCISVAVHGSGVKFGTMSSYVVDLELLTVAGEVLLCSANNNPELFRAACCGLGALGVLTKLTLQCEPAFNLRQRQYGETLTETLDKLDYYLEKSEHFKFYWYPHTENTLAILIDRTRPDKLSKGRKIVTPHSTGRKLLTHLWDEYLLEFLFYLSFYVPILTYVINRLAHWLNKNVLEFEDVSYDVFNFDCLFKQYVNDWAIPIENTRAAIMDLRDWVDDARFSSTAHFPVEVRFVKADDSLLSPTAGRDSTYINIIMFRPYGKDIAKQKYWEAYEKIMEKHSGRPHWSKEHKITATKLRKMYPGFDTWCQIRQKMDPDNMLVNTYLKRMLEL